MFGWERLVFWTMFLTIARGEESKPRRTQAKPRKSYDAGSTLATHIEELHRQIREIQGLETSNRETERTVQVLDDELRVNLTDLDPLRVEREELADGVELFERPPCPYNTRIVPTRTLIQGRGRGLSWFFLIYLYPLPSVFLSQPTTYYMLPMSFIFNNIPALCSYLLCFHIHSR